MIEKLNILRALPKNTSTISMPKVAPMKQDIKYGNPEIANITIKLYELFEKKINIWYETKIQNNLDASFPIIQKSSRYPLEYILKDIYKEIYNEINRS